MTAYMVVFARIKDRERFTKEYGMPTSEVIKKFGGEYLVRTPKVTAIEGSFGDGASAVISKWPNRDAIERFWNSPDYQPLKEVRQPLADCEVVIIESPV